ncbi:unnamed protein product [Lymnaea stagnalis]|uniref:Transmembrane protein n=1 Tax=Lymnaea stagnalis TaxID=6523 RepID=A0AAV2HLE6_LYMST
MYTVFNHFFHIYGNKIVQLNFFNFFSKLQNECFYKMKKTFWNQSFFLQIKVISFVFQTTHIISYLYHLCSTMILLIRSPIDSIHLPQSVLLYIFLPNGYWHYVHLFIYFLIFFFFFFAL